MKQAAAEPSRDAASADTRGGQGKALRPPAYGVATADLGIAGLSPRSGIALRAAAAAPQPPPGAALKLAACACGGGCPACALASLKGVDPKAAWTNQLSQPDEAAERQADARAVSALRQRPATALRSSIRAGLPARVPAAIAERAFAGRPLDRATVVDLESRFATSFDPVRIHDDAQAAALADAADARAFTVGNHIFFNRGEYRPRSPTGRALLAHELAHVEQGHGDEARLWRKGKGEVVLGEPTINRPSRLRKPGKGYRSLRRGWTMPH